MGSAQCFQNSLGEGIAGVVIELGPSALEARDKNAELRMHAFSLERSKSANRLQDVSFKYRT